MLDRRAGLVEYMSISSAGEGEASRSIINQFSHGLLIFSPIVGKFLEQAFLLLVGWDEAKTVMPLPPFFCQQVVEILNLPIRKRHHLSAHSIGFAGHIFTHVSATANGVNPTRR